MARTDDLLDSIVEEVTGRSTAAAAPAPTPTTTAAPETQEEKPAATASAMTDLMATSPLLPAAGDVLTGTVIDISSNMMLLDLGAYGTGIVLGRETKDGMAVGKITIGDTVSATVTDCETEEGYIELSIREASYDKAWNDLEQKAKDKAPIVTRIRDANKGGLIVEVNGVSGFLPVSQLASENYPRVEDGDKNKILELLKQLIGRDLTVCILDANRTDEKLIVSEKAAGSSQEREALTKLRVGDIIEGAVSGVVQFGAFVKFYPPTEEGAKGEGVTLEGLVHISELAWQLIDDPRNIIKTGDHVKAKVIGIEDTRISLSIKALERDPWESVLEKYTVGQIVEGKVDKMSHFGAFVYLDSDIHGLAHVSEFRDLYPGKKFEDMIGVGKSYSWKILSIEPKSHRMGLLLYTKEMIEKEKNTAPDTAKADN